MTKPSANDQSLPELLAPAGNWESLKAAVENGADAVYLGGKTFSARSYAANFDDEYMKRAVEYAHLRGVKIYVTVNILLDDDELKQAAEYVRFLYNTGVDAVIVQDIGLLKVIKSLFPDLEVHASTQMTIHNLEGVKALEQMGADRVVLARELSIDEIRFMAGQAKIGLEVFVHGALCFCYSGQCLMSSLIGGRSGNRGKCAQPCRLKFSVESDGRMTVARNMHVLSPKDLNMIEHLPDLIKIRQIKSLKVEGRMKRPEYVAVVVGAYRRALDLFKESPKNYRIKEEEIRKLKQIFNRGFTTGYYYSRPGKAMMSYESGKNRGLLIGKVLGHGGKGYARIKLYGDLNKGDGIEVWTKKGTNTGTVVEFMEIKGKQAEKASRSDVVDIRIKGGIEKGDLVYKTSNIKQLLEARKTYETEIPRRLVGINMEAEFIPGRPMKLKITDFDGNEVTVCSKTKVEKAVKRPLTQKDIRSKLDRLGSTPFFLNELKVKLVDDPILPFSELNETRREAVNKLMEKRILSFKRPEVSERDYKDRLSQFIVPRGKQVSAVKPLLAVRVDSVEMAERAYNSGADEVYFGGEAFFRKPFSIDDYRKAVNIAGKLNKKIFFVFPRITTNERMEKIKKELTDLIKLNPDGFLAGNLGVLNVLKQKAVTCIADFSLNMFNHVSGTVLKEFRVKRVTLSPELRLSQIKETVSGLPGMETEVIVHGLLPMMVTKHCIIESVESGDNPEKCRGICKQCKTYVLRDRMNKTFPLWTDQDCHTHIMNCVELMTLEELPRIIDTGIASIRIEGRQMDEEELAQVIKAYRTVLDMGEECINIPSLQDFIEKAKRRGYTKGHFLRGVE